MKMRKRAEDLLMGMRVTRWSWWTHWRELADFILPRRYRWLVTPNMMSRGQPINQHILDSTGTLSARNLASGLMTGCTDPTKQWFRLRINRIDSTQTSPISLWLAECERLLLLIFQESNFYSAAATFYFDLVVWGTALIIMYEDYENVVHFINPCAGEYYVDVDNKLEVCRVAREFTYTIDQTVQEFGLENCSRSVQQAYREGGANLSRELIIAHLIEPNNDGNKYGLDPEFTYREVYWEWGGSTSPQGGSASPPGFLRIKGYHEKPFACGRWDLVSNDPYGRSPAMDALPDIKQLQHEVRRKAQAIDKLVSPPMIADIQLKNQPASLIPNGITYVAGQMSQPKPGMAPIYTVQPPVKEIMEDLNEVRERIGRTFFNDILKTASQYETRSNVTAMEWDMRKAESMVMLGPVLERITGEFQDPTVERVFAMAARAGILPPPPPEIAGAHINLQFVSMLERAQSAAAMSGIERIFAMAGNLASADPQAMDVVDFDYGLTKSSHLLNNDPKLIRSPEQLQQIRADRQKQQQAQQQAEMAEKLAAGAKTLSETDVGGGQNAMQMMAGQ